MAHQPTLRELAEKQAADPTADQGNANQSVRIEDEQSFGFDVTQLGGGMQAFCYHHLVTVDFIPAAEARDPDKILVTMWAHIGEITGYRLRALAHGFARGRGLSIEVKEEKSAEAYSAADPFVFGAVFKVRKKQRGEGGMPTEGPGDPPDFPGARDVDPDTFNARPPGG
jgi:hypothetical protein